MLTKAEKDIVDLLGFVQIAINELPVLHPSDMQEATYSIHALQNIVLSRPGFRELHNISLDVLQESGAFSVEEWQELERRIKPM